MYPPANFEEEPLRLTTLNEALLSLKHAKNLSFENIIFDSGRHYAVEMKQCENVVFENCKIKNFVKGGVVIDGRLNKIKNCEINGIGAFGVSLSGGNTKTLEAGGNEVVGCKIWDIGWDQKSQMPGVIFDRKSVGNRVANCEIFETPHFAIRIPGGNDNIVENNYLHDLPYYHHFDGGAIYVATGRQAQARGNVIRGNRLENIPTNGVYCDNYTMGVLIENNVFKNVGNGGRFFAAAHMNGGGQNLIQKNIFYECQYAAKQASFAPKSVWNESFPVVWDKALAKFSPHAGAYSKYPTYKKFAQLNSENERRYQSSIYRDNVLYNKQVPLGKGAEKFQGANNQTGKMICESNALTASEIFFWWWEKKIKKF